MLTRTSRKFRENLQRYIMNGIEVANYDDRKKPENFKEAAQLIWDIFQIEGWLFELKIKSEFEIFEEWCSGLPSILDTCYYYNRSAQKDLEQIYEATPEEIHRNYNTEQKCEHRLTFLIYNEIKHALNTT